MKRVFRMTSQGSGFIPQTTPGLPASKFILLIKKICHNLPSRQNRRKSSVEECIFEYMALHFECRFNKNSLLQCYFLAILPVGYLHSYDCSEGSKVRNSIFISRNSIFISRNSIFISRNPSYVYIQWNLSNSQGTKDFVRDRESSR